MIRAVINNGLIRPLEPLPPAWQEGHEVVVADSEDQTPFGAEDIDKWSEDMKTLTAELNDPEEWRKIDAALAQADRENKAIVRRDMGLPG
jgi:hypothetical protein